MIAMIPVEHTFNSPKRKRTKGPPGPKISPIQLNTNLSEVPLQEESEACESPRTRVAYHFKGLQIESAELEELELVKELEIDGSMDEGDVARKRVRMLDRPDNEIPETPQTSASTFSREFSFEPINSSVLEQTDEAITLQGAISHSKRLTSKLARAYPSINRLADSKSRDPEIRSFTPPLGAMDATTVEVEDTVADSDRGALTWHDDEITGHDPDDPEDDGEGINGIGFKPTAAQARARSERRKQQLAEYRSRESREARAKRSERRRGGSPTITMSLRDEGESGRRVRFSDAQIIDLHS